ncbi:hypothetical protein BDW59DRAFT_23257 [Aspergillus cavernicola]|uniref:Uncharacterized protein n=1 Tax=Aspergillus cavernicola TaxID=176166 RepID=A0ABR4IR76_9EURO
MSTVSITRDLEPYLASLRMYLATDGPTAPSGTRTDNLPVEEAQQQPMAPSTNDVTKKIAGVDVHPRSRETHPPCSR